MLFKKIHVVINIHFRVFKHDIYFCLQFICRAFCVTLKVKKKVILEKVKEYKAFFVCLNLIQRFKFGTHFKGYNMDEKSITKSL